jgi:hypothetical protein
MTARLRPGTTVLLHQIYDNFVEAIGAEPRIRRVHVRG